MPVSMRRIDTRRATQAGVIGTGAVSLSLHVHIGILGPKAER